MIAINKASLLEGKDLLENWQTTFSIVVANLLNRHTVNIADQTQVMIYLDKLGELLFDKNRSAKEQWIGLFFIFATKQRVLYKFLDSHCKNSWRLDMNFNVLCTIDNLLNETDADAFEVTKLRLAFYRGIM